MNTRTAIYLVAICTSIGLPAVAVADSDFYCGESLVEQGMTLMQVQKLCGPPTEQTADRWIYDRGPDEFLVIIHVNGDGTVGLIEQEQQED